MEIGMRFSDGTTTREFLGFPVPYGTSIGISQQKEIKFPVVLDFSEITKDGFFITANETIIHKASNVEVAAWNNGQFQVLKKNISGLGAKKYIGEIGAELISRKREMTYNYFYEI